MALVMPEVENMLTPDLNELNEIRDSQERQVTFLENILREWSEAPREGNVTRESLSQILALNNQLTILEENLRETKNMIRKAEEEWKSLVKPDSARIVELLPSFSKGDLFFINRSDTMEELFRIHVNNLRTRVSRRHEGPEIGLLDAPFGMGKSYFSDKYLSLVAREASKPDGLFNYKEGTWEQTTLNELLSAKTLHICLSTSSLNCARAVEVVCEEIVKQIRSDWGVSNFYWRGGLTGLIEKIANKISPVFLILDEFGKSFECSDSMDYELKIFTDFVLTHIQPIIYVTKVYLLLSGEARFMNFIGGSLMKFENQSPLSIVRVNIPCNRIV